MASFTMRGVHCTIVGVCSFPAASAEIRFDTQEVYDLSGVEPYEHVPRAQFSISLPADATFPLVEQLDDLHKYVDDLERVVGDLAEERGEYEYLATVELHYDGKHSPDYRVQRFPTYSEAMEWVEDWSNVRLDAHRIAYTLDLVTRRQVSSGVVKDPQQQ